MNTVYVVQDPDGKEILPAKDYGNISVMLTGREHSHEAAEILDSRLSHIQPGDYLILIGNPRNIGLATHFALVHGRGRLNLLVWKRDRYEYVPEEIVITNNTYDTTRKSNKSANAAAPHGR